MAGEIEPFVLPRTDWYDTISTDPETGEIKGRIYKDALIENFNAIENKLNELSALDAFEIALPDFSEISYDDVSLASDDNKVVNLKSFLNIVKCYNYPVDLRFSGTTCTYVRFWTYPECSFIVRDDEQNTGASSTKKYIYLNITNGNVTASSSATTPENNIFIGMYVDSQIVTSSSPTYTNINLLWALSKMKFSPKTVQNINTSKDARARHVINNGGSICGFFDVDRYTPTLTFMPVDYGKSTR